MKVKIINLEGKETGEIELPKQFTEPIRTDIIKRAVLAFLANKRQPYGANEEAGKKHSVELSKRRRKYRGSYGFGISRTPRKILTRNGTRFYWVGAFAPNTVGGRKAHPPKPWKIWAEKINLKEKRKAIRAAISATFNKEKVKERGHKTPEKYPFIITTEFENINKTSQVKKTLEKIGFKEELERAKSRTRAGKGKTRGRRKKTAKTILIVASKKDAPILKAAKNLPGVDVTTVKNLNAHLLAPGGHPGRITLYTEDTIKIMKEENLYETKTVHRIKKKIKNTLKRGEAA